MREEVKWPLSPSQVLQPGHQPPPQQSSLATSRPRAIPCPAPVQCPPPASSASGHHTPVQDLLKNKCAHITENASEHAPGMHLDLPSEHACSCSPLSHPASLWRGRGRIFQPTRTALWSTSECPAWGAPPALAWHLPSWASVLFCVPRRIADRQLCLKVQLRKKPH